MCKKITVINLTVESFLGRQFFKALDNLEVNYSYISDMGRTSFFVYTKNQKQIKKIMEIAHKYSADVFIKNT